MGKRKKINRLISRWIKSDLPEDRSTVLLLGVTRIPTSPTPTRRPFSLPSATAPTTESKPPLVNARRRSSSASRKRLATFRNSIHKQTKFETSTLTFTSAPSQETIITNSHEVIGNAIESGSEVTSSNSNFHGDSPKTIMDRSVDSIGTCSLDVEASMESSDWSEASSIGTLRSTSLPISAEPRLPSYLSLACTVNGYSTITNYDPERLARSRDTSPHRPNENHAPQDNLTATYTTYNNLLSPPNLVPLPIYNNISSAQKDIKSNMSDNTTVTSPLHRREFYSTNSKVTTTYITSESKMTTSSTIYSSDSVDSCLENGIRSSTNKGVRYETNISNTNGNFCPSETSTQEYSSTKEKSVIQQRVERLYGPGFLAQGFMLLKRRKNKSFETENLEKNFKSDQDKHSKSMNDQLSQDESLESGMKQSTSSPTLPVFRHLRPEFRAQLPIVKAKKVMESNMQKSVTIPILVEGVKVNGHSNDVTDREPCDTKTVILNGNTSINSKEMTNGAQDVCDKNKCENNSKEIVTKDGYHFLNILEKETRRLLSLADQAEKELEQPDLPEEAKGYLRSASGKAKLLVSQKMQQFKGLCTNNIKQIEGEAFPTTNEDLQGFWDMIMLQIDQVDTLFKELNTLRANNWQEEPVVSTNGTLNKPRKVVKTTRPLSAAAEENRKLREVQRKKMLEEKRKAMREQQNNPTRQSIEIFVPESS